MVLVSGAVGLGIWVISGVLSYSLGMLGFGSRRGLFRFLRKLRTTELVASFDRECKVFLKPNFVMQGLWTDLEARTNICLFTCTLQIIQS